MNIKMPNTVKLCGMNYAIVTKPQIKQQIADLISYRLKEWMSTEYANAIDLEQCFRGHKQARLLKDYCMVSDYDLLKILQENGHRLFDNALDFEIAMNTKGKNYIVLYNRRNPKESPMYITSYESITLDNYYDISTFLRMDSEENASGKNWLCVRLTTDPNKVLTQLRYIPEIKLLDGTVLEKPHRIMAGKPWQEKLVRNGHDIYVYRKHFDIREMTNSGQGLGWQLHFMDLEGTGNIGDLTKPLPIGGK